MLLAILAQIVRSACAVGEVVTGIAPVSSQLLTKQSDPERLLSEILGLEQP